MTVADVYDHYLVARQRVAFDLHWRLRAARHGNQYLTGDAARRDFEAARAYEFSLDRRKSAWEVGDPEQRIIQIGGELLMTSVERFRQRHPAAIEWLASQGCSEDEAMRRSAAQLAKESRHPFWNSQPKRTVASRTIKVRRGISDHTGDGGTPGAGAGDSPGAAAEPCPGGE